MVVKRLIHRCLLFVLLSPVLFVLTCVAVGQVAMADLKAQKTVRLEAEIPKSFPVLGFWRSDDGVAHCRAFFYGDLTEARAAIPELSLIVPGDGTETCEQSFAYAREHSAWSDAFDWDPRELYSASFAVGPSEPSGRQALQVSYCLDDDSVNTGWYESDGQNLYAPRHLVTFGARFGTRVVILRDIIRPFRLASRPSRLYRVAVESGPFRDSNYPSLAGDFRSESSLSNPSDRRS